MESAYVEHKLRVIHYRPHPSTPEKYLAVTCSCSKDMVVKQPKTNRDHFRKVVRAHFAKRHPEAAHRIAPGLVHRVVATHPHGMSFGCVGCLAKLTRPPKMDDPEWEKAVDKFKAGPEVPALAQA